MHQNRKLEVKFAEFPKKQNKEITQFFFLRILQLIMKAIKRLDRYVDHHIQPIVWVFSKIQDVLNVR